MTPLRFSIVIPTRDRESTLGATLRTCLVQPFDSFEIVVSDNGTTEATRELIDGIGSPRIKYVRPPRPLAMCDHWNFALDQASGEFVIVIGSDDGLLGHALPEIDRMLRQFGLKLLRWDPVSYHWPDLPEREFAKPNELLIPMKQSDWFFPVRRVEGRAAIRGLANFEIPYSDLPMIYCSAVHRNLIGKLRKKTGRVFRSESPDVYSGIAFAHEAGGFHTIGAPMSIGAASAGSTGFGLIEMGGDSPAARDFRSLNREASLLRHPGVPKVPGLAALVADSYWQAREWLFPDDAELRMEPVVMISQILRESHPDSESAWDAVLRAVRVALEDGGADAATREWFESGPARSCREGFDFAPRHRLKRYGQNYLCLDAADFGVSDVAGAAELCEKLLGFRRDGINAHLMPG